MNKSIFHILVVDDDDKIRELIREYLEKNQFLVYLKDQKYLDLHVFRLNE